MFTQTAFPRIKITLKVNTSNWPRTTFLLTSNVTVATRCLRYVILGHSYLHIMCVLLFNAKYIGRPLSVTNKFQLVLAVSQWVFGSSLIWSSSSGLWIIKPFCNGKLLWVKRYSDLKQWTGQGFDDVVLQVSDNQFLQFVDVSRNAFQAVILEIKACGIHHNFFILEQLWRKPHVSDILFIISTKQSGMHKNVGKQLNIIRLTFWEIKSSIYIYMVCLTEVFCTSWCIITKKRQRADMAEHRRIVFICS